jgi:hypothetical protein
MKIQQVPMINKPEKADATDRQKGIPDFVPQPLLAVTPRFQAVVNRDQRSQTSQ